MRLHTEPKTLVRSGTSGETKFKVKMNQKAYEVLSSSLYTDSIRAIVRELSCNAYDAHVAAGRADVPFEIHLPNTLEPFFYVKDFGIGLSDDEIRGREVPAMAHEACGTDANGETLYRLVPILDEEGNQVYTREGGIYTTYFDSSKTESDDFIGALGLGSKTPLSYTDSYQVTSRHNGIRRLYNIFLNEDHEPSVLLLAEDPTDECNGLEVRLTVEPKDFFTFSQKTASALMYFKVKPNVVGHAGSFEFERLPDHTITGDGWYAAPKRYSYDNTTFTAVMANVAYRVDLDHIRGLIDHEVMTLLQTINIVAHFDNGELSFAASREELKYNDHTNAALIKRVQMIREYFIKSVEDTVTKEVPAGNYWDQHEKIKMISKRVLGSDYGLVSLVAGKTEHPILLKYVEVSKTSGFVVCNSAYLVSTFHVKYKGGAMILKKDKTTEWDQYNKAFDKIAVEPASDMLVVLDDVRVGSTKRLRELVRELKANGTRVESVLTIRKVTPKQAANITGYPSIAGVDYVKELNNVVASLGGPTYTVLSTATKKFVTKTASGYSRGPVTIYKISGSGRRHGSIDWSAHVMTPAQEKDGGLFIRIKGVSKEVMNEKGGTVNSSYSALTAAVWSMVSIVNKVKKTKYTRDDVCFVGQRASADLAANKKWIDLYDFARKHASKHKNVIKAAANLFATDGAYGFAELIGAGSYGTITREGKFPQTASRTVKLIKDLDPTSAFRVTMMPLVEAFEEISDDPNFARQMVNYALYVDRDLHVSGKDLVKDGGLEKTYPMLTFVGKIQYHSIEKFFDYISLVDRS